MARKLILEPYALVTAGDMSGAITSPQTNVKNLDQVYIQIDWSGVGCTGSFDVQMASELKNDPTNLTWIDLGFSSPILVSANTGNHLIYLKDIPFHLIRVVYTPTAGTGSVNIIVGGKSTSA